MRFRPPRPVSMTLNLAPMVDVMMCLIIFFLLGSQMVDAERREMKLPWAISAHEASAAELGRRITVNVRPATEAGKPADYLVSQWDGQNLSERVLAAGELDGFIKSRVAAAGGEVKAMRCVIRADRDATYADVEAVLRACGRNHIANVVFGANSGADPEIP